MLDCQRVRRIFSSRDPVVGDVGSIKVNVERSVKSLIGRHMRMHARTGEGKRGWRRNRV